MFTLIFQPDNITTGKQLEQNSSQSFRITAMENGAISQSEGKDPSSFLSDIIGHPVTVKLNSGVVYKGFFFFSSALLLYYYIFSLTPPFFYYQESCNPWTGT